MSSSRGIWKFWRWIPLFKLRKSPTKRISPDFFLVTNKGEHHWVGSLIWRIIPLCCILCNSSRTGSIRAGGKRLAGIFFGVAESLRAILCSNPVFRQPTPLHKSGNSLKRSMFLTCANSSIIPSSRDKGRLKSGICCKSLLSWTTRNSALVVLSFSIHHNTVFPLGNRRPHLTTCTSNEDGFKCDEVHETDCSGCDSDAKKQKVTSI